MKAEVFENAVQRKDFENGDKQLFMCKRHEQKNFSAWPFFPRYQKRGGDSMETSSYKAVFSIFAAVF